ncbi:YfhD family protein [Paenibacillus sp. GCM10012307]|uniref:YfhD family protein n=1 Tax=Paenibacillus roseus TaxID=2798579 RepID=A0A934J586_9BACL|nr:YfhD family protein [Paenibacillus roseus]MBJ6363090.1 YfhD family protein [Paenibacillus roseus]
MAQYYKQNEKSKLPIGKNEDIEFSEEQADLADLKARERAAEADRRAEQ